jgi:hypothetical protein
MKNLSPKIKNSITIGFFILLCIALVFSTRYFVRSVQQDYLNGELRVRHRKENPLLYIEERVKPWMTFDYINVIFKLPPNYFKDTFSITDPKYPNIRIDQYAKRNNVSLSTLLTTIREHISSYFTLH